MGSRRWLPLLLMGLAASTPGVAAQDVEPVAPDSVAAAPAPQAQAVDEFEGMVSPLGAFLRAIAIPGWGHAAVGSHGRGGFYLTTQAVTGYMLARTTSRRSTARELRAVREARIRAELADDGITDEVLIQAALEADDGWADADELVAARQQQFEDWLALGIFTVLLSGADALVSAHLQGFPDVSLTPTTDEGRMELRVRVPVGN